VKQGQAIMACTCNSIEQSQRRVSRRQLIATTAAGTAALAMPKTIFAAATPGASPSPSGDASAIVIGTLRDAQTINPFLTGESEGDWRCKMLFDEFVASNPETYAPEPGLAADWQISELTFTFTLQPTAKFADGSNVTADDVAFTIKGFLAKSTASPRQNNFLSISGAQEFVDGSAEDVLGIKVVNPKTLQITLARSDAPFLFNLHNLFVVPKAQLAGKSLTDDPWFQKPVGAGPFVFRDWTNGKRFTATRNPHYWQRGKPALSGFTHQVIADADSLVSDLIADNIDASNYPAPTAKAQLEQNRTLKVFVPPFGAPNGWMFNCANEWLSKKEVRRAIALALDTKKFTETALHGLGKPGNGPIAPNNWAYDRDLEPIPYDVKTAKEMIRVAGIPDGTTIRFMVNKENDMRQEWLEFTQDSLRQLGIEVVPEVIDYQTVLDRVTSAKDYDACGVDFTGVTAEPSELFNQFHSGGSGNYMGYSNSQLDVLLEAAREEMNLERAKVIYKQVQAIIMDDVPTFFAWYRPFLHVVKRKYDGYTDSAAYGLFQTLEDWTIRG
jgi:peptide/nickel transport system substrate-binding protein